MSDISGVARAVAEAGAANEEAITRILGDEERLGDIQAGLGAMASRLATTGDQMRHMLLDVDTASQAIGDGEMENRSVTTQYMRALVGADPDVLGAIGNRLAIGQNSHASARQGTLELRQIVRQAMTYVEAARSLLDPGIPGGGQAPTQAAQVRSALDLAIESRKAATTTANDYVRRILGHGNS